MLHLSQRMATVAILLLLILPARGRGQTVLVSTGLTYLQDDHPWGAASIPAGVLMRFSLLEDVDLVSGIVPPAHDPQRSDEDFRTLLAGGALGMELELAERFYADLSASYHHHYITREGLGKHGGAVQALGLRVAVGYRISP